MKRIFLTGFMGTGKSAVGEALAEHDGFTCDDLDSLIESRIGCPISEYMAERGEQAFRDIESNMLDQWIRQHASDDPETAGSGCVDPRCAVLACGGGVILRDENRRLLKESGTVIRLMASLQSIYQRVSAHPQTRPLLQGEESLPDRLEKLAAERESLYHSCADIEISTEGKTAQESAALIIEALR